MAGWSQQIYIGPLPLGIDTAGVETFSRSTGYRWPSQNRIARPNAAQFVGADDETLTINGYVHPSWKGDAKYMDALRELANQGIPYMVLTGTGYVLGKYVITSVKDDFSTLMDDGRPRRMDFTIALKRYGNDQ